MRPVPLVAPDPDSALFLMQQIFDESAQVLGAILPGYIFYELDDTPCYNRP